MRTTECSQTDIENWLTGKLVLQDVLDEFNKLRDPKLNKHLHTIGSIFEVWDHIYPKYVFMPDESEFEKNFAHQIIRYFKIYFGNHLNIARQQEIPEEHMISYLAYAIEHTAAELEIITGIDHGNWMITILYVIDNRQPHTIGHMDNYTVRQSADEIEAKNNYVKIDVEAYKRLTNLVMDRVVMTAKPELHNVYQNIKLCVDEKYYCYNLIRDLDKFELSDHASTHHKQVKIKQFQDFLIQCIDSDSSIYVLDQPDIKRVFWKTGRIAQKFIPVELDNLLKLLDSEDLPLEQRKVRIRQLSTSTTLTSIPNMYISDTTNLSM